MRVVFHPQVFTDISEITEHYKQAANPDLSNDFLDELSRGIAKTSRRSELFSTRRGDIQRVNLRRFPYHFLFRIVDDTLRILVVRHHKRHPAFGAKRR